MTATNIKPVTLTTFAVTRQDGFDRWTTGAGDGCGDRRLHTAALGTAYQCATRPDGARLLRPVTAKR
jgi:hypothetical protein